MKSCRVRFSACAAAAALALSGCGASAGVEASSAQSAEASAADASESTEKEESAGVKQNLLGGWKINSGKLSLDENEAAKEAFEKAAAGIEGRDYEPIALLGTQVVAGTNYSVLARVTDEAGNVEYSVLRIYEDLKGGAEITSEREATGLPAAEEGMTGAWEMNAGDFTLEGNEDVAAALEDAVSGGELRCEPVALAASQLVAGMNYLVFCRVTDSASGSCGFAFAEVYVDLQGNAEHTGDTQVAP